MGTFTQERLQKVIDGFVLNGQALSVEPYGNGHINDTFLLIMKEDGTEKKYILQRMNGDIFKNSEELMENIMRVTSFLKEKITEQGGNPDRETLQVIPTKEGKTYYKEVTGDGWRIYPFITDTVSYDAGGREELNKSGIAFGNFQYLLSDFPAKELHETIPNFHNTVNRFANFKKKWRRKYSLF